MSAGKARAAGSSWFGAPPKPLRPLDEAAARADLDEIADLARERSLPHLAALIAVNGPDAAFLAAVLDLSDFMRDFLRRRPEALEDLLASSLVERLEAINRAIAALPFAEDATEASMMEGLRLLKAEAHFLIAFADLGRPTRSSA